jgi:ABC-type microcin C transport system permease subunit YejB
MTAYIIRRILFMIPTLFGIMLATFVVVQFAPGGPVENIIAKLTGADTGATSRVAGSPGGDFGARGQMQTPSTRNTAARAGSTPRSSSNWNSSSASTSRPTSASSSCCGITSASISARAISATRR